MKIIVDHYDPCPCNVKIREFLAQRQASGYRDLGIDSIIQCDCDAVHLLIEQDGIRTWVLYQTPEGAQSAQVG